VPFHPGILPRSPDIEQINTTAPKFTCALTTTAQYKSLLIYLLNPQNRDIRLRVLHPQCRETTPIVVIVTADFLYSSHTVSRTRL